MTTTAAAPSRIRDMTRFGVPVLLLAAGAVIRFAAYLSISPQGTPQGFAEALCVWDCYWYGDVARHGYQAYPETLNFGGPGGIANWAFFPLYPMLLGAAGRIVPASPAILGAIVSPVLTLGATVSAWPLFEGDRRGYFLFATLLLAGPFSFYFATGYSESLFLLLTVVAFVQLHRRRYLGAGLAGALLSATRTVGVLFIFAILTQILLDLGNRVWRELPRRPDMLLGLALVPAGLFAFMAWLYLTTGDALAFAHIQRAWDRAFVEPATGLWNALTVPGGQVRDAQILAVASLAGIALCGLLAWRRQLPASIFCTLSLVLALTQGVESMLRFVVALAPLGVVLCQMLGRNRWIAALSALVFASADYMLTIAWIHQQGALM